MKKSFARSSLTVLMVMGVIGIPFSQASGSSSGTADNSFSFRQVLCLAPPVRASSTPQRSSAKLECSPPYLITSARLQLPKSPNSSSGYFEKVAPDPHLKEVPDTPSTTGTVTQNELLSGVNATSSSVRYVLGPALLTSPSISSADSVEINSQWVVNFGLTVHGALLWQADTRRDFHEEIAAVANGVVYAVTIIEPSQKQYTSFGGFGEMGSGLSQSEATALAGSMWQPKKK